MFVLGFALLPLTLSCDADIADSASQLGGGSDGGSGGADGQSSTIACRVRGHASW